MHCVRVTTSAELVLASVASKTIWNRIAITWFSYNKPLDSQRLRLVNKSKQATGRSRWPIGSVSLWEAEGYILLLLLKGCNASFSHTHNHAHTGHCDNTKGLVTVHLPHSMHDTRNGQDSDRVFAGQERTMASTRMCSNPFTDARILNIARTNSAKSFINLTMHPLKLCFKFQNS